MSNHTPPLDGKKLNKKTKTYLIVGAGAVAVYGVYRYRQNQMTADAATTAATDQTAAGDSAGGFSAAPGGWRYRPWRPHQRPMPHPHNPPPPITTDAEWEQAVIKRMHGLGYNRQAVALALSRWFAHLDVSHHEADLIHIAVGLMGNPPHNPGPPHIRHHKPHHDHHRAALAAVPPAGAQQQEFPDSEAANAIHSLTGFYRVIPSMQIVHVANSERFLVRPETVAAMRPRPHMQYITPANEINRLPIGGWL